jgi:putative ABC transport system permease protein
MEVKVGDPVRLEVQEGRRPVADVRVARLVDDIVGVQAVMERSALDRIAGEGPRLSGAFLQTDAAVSGVLNDHLRRLPKVAGIVLTGATRAAVVKMLNDSLVWFTNLLTVFSVLIAIGVVYNGARLALGERERELATLRVIGFTRDEAWRITTGELAVQVLAGIPMGWLAGWGFVELTAWATASELMRLPPLVTPANCALAAGVVAASAALVALHTRRALARLDLVAVLKAKE